MRSFIRCFVTGIVVAVIDIAASVVMEMPVSRFTYHFFMTLYMSSIELVILAWFIFVTSILFYKNARRRRIIAIILAVSYALYVLLILSNPWTELMYSLDSQMVYSRGPCFMLMVVLYAVYAISLIILVIVNRRHIPIGYSGIILLMNPVILAVSITVQLLISGWLMIVPGYTICLVLAFLFMQTQESHQNKALVQALSRSAMTDKLTGLYNRTGAETVIRTTEQNDYGKKCLVLVIDLDDLKSINDNHGHDQGDRALKAIAEQMKGFFRATDIVCRFGGDEFIAYLVGDWTQEQAQRSLGLLTRRLSVLCVGEHNDVPIHGSIGAVIGTVGYDDFEALCKCADIAMYHVKRSKKGSYAIYSPEMENELPPPAAAKA